MRLSGIVLATVLLSSGIAVAGEPMDFTLEGLDGHNHRLAEHRGRATLVVFVAPFCGSCRAFVDALDDAHRDLWVVHLTAPSRPYGRGLELIDGDASLARRLDIGKLPAWIALDAAGVEFARGSGKGGLAALEEGSS